MAAEESEKIAIVGGGIAGLYCAYILGKQGKKVTLFEATNRFGGRILTVRLQQGPEPRNAEIQAIVPTGEEDQDPVDYKKLEFYAEFGPMRVELDKQILLRGLFEHLDIKPDARNAKDKTEASLVEFPAYASPASVGDPSYELRPEEEGKTPLQLMQLAMLRIMMKVELSEDDDSYKKFRDDLISDIQLAAATGEDILPVYMDWVRTLRPDQHIAIQFYGEIDRVPLYAQGFWNLLSDYLSHDAIMKIRDLGTFYHLLSLNPNAAEWLTWWLIGLSISDGLKGVYGGMSSLIIKLRKKIADDCQGRVVLRKDSEVTAIEFVKVQDDSGTEKNTGLLQIKIGETLWAEQFSRVILALPKGPIKRLLQRSAEVFDAEKELPELLGSAAAFPMVKVFVVVKNRWWGNEPMANRYATRVPTRELHYWPATHNDHYGMIMFYTDLPAQAFWSNYVPPGKQMSVSYKDGPDNPLPEATEKRLLDKIVQYISENNVPDLKKDDILWWGIRDWGRFPYGGANHMWRPERKYWHVMGRLGEITTDTPARIHICGEAYSDYHGFIEGALRSASYTVHRILEGDNPASLMCLRQCGLVGTDKYSEYLDSLKKWCNLLDTSRMDQRKQSFLYKGECADLHPKKT
ncbi:flavin monoamine oxidase family protein [Pseudomonas sputi]|uniref:flavin monoamine oxidase family protein n=1 Tax=Pseudomonas sputi TaxID=2892325 RepID=UPI001F35D6BD|nr:FAD-dependent oxidoreductase [Pseudomonas sputi]